MSNAEPSLAPAVVKTDLLNDPIKNKQDSSSSSDPPSPAKNYCALTTPSSLSTSSSNSEVNSTEEQLNLSMTSNNSNTASNDVDCQHAINNSLSNNLANQTASTSINILNVKPQANLNSKSSYYHPNQPQQSQQFIINQQSPMNLNHFNMSQGNPRLNGAGLQYIQLNSNSNSTPLTCGSPISSLTSSPSTINSSIQYINHQQQSHINKQYQSGGGMIHSVQAPAHYQYQLPQHNLPQHQQFQQLQQFHSQFQTNYKDTRWLTLEVCREHQRNKCNRDETECKFAHPLAHVEIINGKVIACYDSLKGKCTRKEPPCKYLHPPQHLKDQLLQNGKNNLVLRQVALAMMQQQQTNVQTNPETTAALLAAATRTTPQYATFTATSPTNPNQNSSAANQFISNGGLPIQLANGQPHLLQMLTNGYSNPNLMAHNLHLQQQNIYANDPNSTLLQNSTISPPILTNANNILPPQQRTDRLQICKEFQKKTCDKSISECAFAHPPAHCPLDQGNTLVIVCVDFIKGKCSRETCKYFHPPEHLVAQLKKQKLTNNALAAAAYASNNLGQQQQFSHQFSPLNIATSTSSLSQMNSYNPFRLNRQPFDSNSLQYIQITDQHSQYQLQQQRQQYISASQLLSSRINALNNNASIRAATSFLDNTNIPYANNNNNQARQISAIASSTSSIPATVGSNSQHDINDANGTIVTLENGQTYQLPQYHMGATIFQRGEDLNSQIDNNNAKSVSVTSATANNMVDNVPSKKRQHEAIEQDFNPMSSGNIYASNLSVKRTALTDTKTGMPIFQPLSQGLHQLGPQATGVGISHIHPSHTQQQVQQIALSQQLAALNNYQAYNFSQMQYAPIPTTFPLTYNGQPSNIPRL